jgi:hypothetical protein
MSRAYSRDENYTCFQNDTQISGCYVQWDNATDPVTGAREGSPTGATSFDCRYRQWYKVSKASTNVVKGASGPIWSDPFLLIQTGTLGLAAARQLVTKDGAFVGVAGVDFELSTIETLLQDTTDSSGGTLTVFVVDSVGKMISSSVRSDLHPFHFVSISGWCGIIQLSYGILLVQTSLHMWSDQIEMSLSF